MKRISPIMSYRFMDTNVHHELDLDTVKVHVKFRGQKEDFMTFDKNCYCYDNSGRQVGKIYLEDSGAALDPNVWVYRSNGGSVVIKGFGSLVRESVLKTERLVVEFYMTESQMA